MPPNPQWPTSTIIPQSTLVADMTCVDDVLNLNPGNAAGNCNARWLFFSSVHNTEEQNEGAIRKWSSQLHERPSSRTHQLILVWTLSPKRSSYGLVLCRVAFRVLGYVVCVCVCVF